MRTALSLAALAALVSSAAAQPALRPSFDGPSVSLDVLHALGDDVALDNVDMGDGTFGDGTLGLSSTVVTLHGRVPVSRRLALAVDVPFSYSGVEVTGLGGPSASESDLSLGNPAVGLDARLRPDFEVGALVRVPLFNRADDLESFGWQGGLSADYERFEAYVPDVATASVSALYSPTVGRAGRVRLGLTPTVFATTGGGGGAASVALGYVLQGELGLGRVAMNAGVFGRPVLSGEAFEVLETNATAMLGASVKVGGVRPGVVARLPLDIGRMMFTGPTATVGFSLDVPVR